eukprot:CAMPEP_0115021328 /NCGR_PEP_ID=MMETSP0216-20121206/30817_1 /TAXON_ID=223996 /ORGANISM="Protocruzia adherens, Strain Boccale" /LENGTH=204 /DNA_ID=CAMNT_0002393655 /DNA_START=44 /DNA_END=658 /DNA_ORIENTATION=-
MNKDYDFLFKLVLIGDSAVGKSSILIRFADDTFSENYLNTIGVDFRFRTLGLDAKNVKLQIWDTAGQERFRTLTSTYYKGADGAILVYDCTNRESYNNIADWISEIRKHAGDEINILLIGNKSDLEEEMEVTPDEAEVFASEHNIKFMSASAKTAFQITEAFETMARDLIVIKKSQEPTNPEPTEKLKLEPKQKIKKHISKCCK